MLSKPPASTAALLQQRVTHALSGPHPPARRNPFLRSAEDGYVARWGCNDYATGWEGGLGYADILGGALAHALFIAIATAVLGLLVAAVTATVGLPAHLRAETVDQSLLSLLVVAAGVVLVIAALRRTETRGATASITSTCWLAELLVVAAAAVIAARTALMPLWPPLVFLIAPVGLYVLQETVRLIVHRGRRQTRPREFAHSDKAKDAARRLEALITDKKETAEGDEAARAPSSRASAATSRPEGAQPKSRSEAPAAMTLMRDLTANAREGKAERVIGRDDVLEELEVYLGQLKPANVALLGLPGIGKTAIVQGLAHNWLAQHPKRRLLLLDPGAVGASGGIVGDVERTWRAIITEATKANTILVIDEAHAVFEDATVANLLKPAMADGSLHVVAMSTEKEWRRDVAKDGALVRRFNTISLSPPSAEEALPIIRYQADLAANHNRVRISDEAVQAAVRLAARYVTDEALPAAPVKLIAQAASRAQVRGQKTVDAGLVAETLASQLKLPVAQLVGSQRELLSRLPETLKAAVIGQDRCLDELARAVQAKLMGISDAKRPASAILLGPTGVGKTEAAKALAEALAPGNPNALLHLHMSEYQERHDLAKLTGTAPGYVGYAEGGKLTNGAKNAQVILFDEIEKAHPDLQRAVLLPLLDEGSLTDNAGETVSFAQKVVILTSNLGAAGGASQREGMLEAAERFFLPEVWARVGHKLVFDSLTPTTAASICDKLLDALASRMRDEHNIELTLSPELRDELVAAGFDADGGARSLRPIITNTVEGALTMAMLRGDVRAGESVIVVATPHRELHATTHRAPDGRQSLGGFHATLVVAVQPRS